MRASRGGRRSQGPRQHRPAEPVGSGQGTCPHFGPCGGCSHLDIDYDVEVERKQQAYRELLATFPALKGVELQPLLRAEQPLHYRASLKVPFAASREGAICGFFERGSHRIVNLSECAIQEPALVELVNVTRELVRRARVPIYHEHVHRGILRHLVARVGAGTGELLAGLVVRRGGAPQVKRVAWQLGERLRDRGLVGVVENVNPKQTNAVLGPRTTRLVGRPVLFEESDGLRIRTSLTSFAQVNPRQASALYAEVLDKLGPLSGTRVAELYAGYGPIGLRLAKQGARVVAIERLRAAVRDGIAIARANGLADRIHFLHADAADGLRQVEDDGDLDALVVDPPRRGLTEAVIDQLAAMRFAKLVYVSCNPKTLLRDLSLLSNAFHILSIRPVDLFPRTVHVESVAMLERRP